MRTKRDAQRAQSGFTLLEVLITVAILGIIVAIGYPNYVDYVRESRRTEAKAELQEAMNEQESYYTTNNSYTTDLVNDLNYPNPPLTEDEWYQLAARQCPGAPPLEECVELVAQAQGDQGDDLCGDFVLDATGRRTVENEKAGMTADACW